MAEAISEYGKIKFRRSNEGLQLHIKLHPSLEAAIKASAQSRTCKAEANKDVTCWAIPDLPQTGDHRLLQLLAAKGSSEGTGLVIPIMLPRTTAQVQSAAEEIGNWVGDWARKHLTPIDITLTIKRRESSVVA